MNNIKLNENEQIVQIKDYPKYYITSHGRVWSTHSNKWLTPTVNKRGNHQREYVSLGRGNKKYIHQLVAQAFVDNPNNYIEVDHIDTNGLNNHANNLRWVTHNENMANDITQEHVKKNHGWLVEIREIETGKLFYGHQAVADAFGVSKGTVNNHLKGKVKKPRWELTGNRIDPEI